MAMDKIKEEPTRQIQLQLSSDDKNDLQSVITRIGTLYTFPSKNLMLQTVSIIQNSPPCILLNFNKIKASLLFYDAIQSNLEDFNIVDIHFSSTTYGSYDCCTRKKPSPPDCTELFIANCFNTSISGNEMNALQELKEIINKYLNDCNFKSLKAMSISLVRSYVYLSFSCPQSLNEIYNIITADDWISPSISEFPITGGLHWQVERTIPVPIIPFHKTQEAKQIYYATKNSSKIPGLKLIEGFVSSEEETEILNWLERMNDESGEDYWETRVQGKKNPMKRRVQHYGYRFNYDTNMPDLEPKDSNLPDIFQPLIKRFLDIGLIDEIPNQLTINEYTPGQGILSHIDTHSAFSDHIISISLSSDCGMEFCKYDDPKCKIGIYLPRLSCFVLSDEARYAWKHGITKKTFDHVQIDLPDDNSVANQYFPPSELRKRERRISLTFRKVLIPPSCECKFPIPCDVQEKVKPKKKANIAEEMKIEMRDTLTENTNDSEELGRKLEREHVLEFYETAAEHFSKTRHSPWPLISRFLTLRTPENKNELQEHDGLDSNMLVADVGCGNGKYLRCIPSSMTAVGTDISANLLKQSKQLGTHKHDLFVADGLSLPFRDELFDVCLCIAVFHHISTKKRRISLAKELLRIVRPGGRVLVYAWAFEQAEDEVGARKFPQQDCFVPWHLANDKNSSQKEEEILQRYCHVFTEGELESLFQEAGNVSILRSYNDHSNWAVLLSKNE